MSAFGQTGPYQMPRVTFSHEVADGADTLRDGSAGIMGGRPVTLDGTVVKPGGIEAELCLGTLLDDTRNGEAGTIVGSGDVDIVIYEAVTAGERVGIPIDSGETWVVGTNPEGIVGYMLEDGDGSSANGETDSGLAIRARARFVAAPTVLGPGGGG